jgi:hypothetical protein
MSIELVSFWCLERWVSTSQGLLTRREHPMPAEPWQTLTEAMDYFQRWYDMDLTEARRAARRAMGNHVDDDPDDQDRDRGAGPGAPEVPL